MAESNGASPHPEEAAADSTLALNPVVGFGVVDMWPSGSYTGLAALGVLMSLVNSVAVIAMLVLTRRSV